MSGYKNGRLPKSAYLAQLAERKSEKSCHKKKIGIESCMNNGLLCSRDKQKNVLCAGCKILLIPNTASDEEFDKKVKILINSGGVFNCCYDCEFSWYCNKCCFVWYNSYNYASTCFHTFIRKVKDNDYGGGRYSKFTDEELACLRAFFANDIKYSSTPRPMLVDAKFLIELYNKPDREKHFQYYRKAVRKAYSKIQTCNMSLETKSDEDYEPYLITIDDIYDEYEQLVNANKKKNYIKKDQDTEEESDSSIEV